MVEIIDGKKVAEELRAGIKEEVDGLSRKPELHVILVGEDPASKVYVGLKEKKCEEVGIVSKVHKLSEDVSEEDVLGLISELNKEDNVNGILVQMPVPKQISKNKVMKAVIPLPRLFRSAVLIVAIFLIWLAGNGYLQLQIS